jgi:glycosyltransferase involved in cell wall biosynthesis
MTNVKDSFKLLIATDCFLPRWDGIARVLSEILPTFPFETTVIAPDFKGRPVHIPNTIIHRTPLSNIKIGDFPVAKISDTMMEHHVAQADVVWVHTLSTIGRRAIKIAKKLNKKVVFFIHSIDYELVPRSIKAPLLVKDAIFMKVKRDMISAYNDCDLIMSPSPNVDKVLEWNEITTPAVRTQLGVDLETFKPGDKALAKQRLDLTGKFVLGFCGRLAAEKNLETLLEAFRRIRPNRKDVVLLVVGSGLKKYERMLSRESGVIFVGSKDNVVPYLQAMDIFVLPSFVETTSLATLEAMACGAVPVVTAVGEVVNYVVEKKNGVFFPIGNSIILARKLEWLMGETYVLEQLAKHARKTVEERYSSVESFRRITKILRNM